MLPKHPRHTPPLLPPIQLLPINNNNTSEILSNPPISKHRRQKPFTMQQSTFFNLLLQFALFSFAMAEETVTAQSHSNPWQYGAGGGVLGFIVLVLDIIVWSTSLPFFSTRVPFRALTP